MRPLVVVLILLLLTPGAEAQSPAPAPTRPPASIPKRTPKVAVALPNYDVETSTRLQIFLDNNNFGPGKIDGEMGEFFRYALISYKYAKGLRLTGVVEPKMIEQVPTVYTTYMIRSEDLKFVGPSPTRPSAQAKLKSLPYGSLLEFVAERFHSSAAYIEKLNPGKDWEHLQPGELLDVPNVQPFEIEKLTETFVPKNPAFATRKVCILTRERVLEIFEGERLLAMFPITPGSATLPAPKGTWKIVGIAVLPWFRHDEGVLNYGVRTDDFYNLPPGPNNPVGILWMGLSKAGIGIHGTNNPETIGRAASHGCIRLANWDAARVKDLVSVGNVVEIF